MADGESPEEGRRGSAGVEGARQGRGPGHRQATFEPRLVGGEGVSRGQVSGGISDLRQGLSFPKLWLRDLGQVTDCSVLISCSEKWGCRSPRFQGRHEGFRS